MSPHLYTAPSPAPEGHMGPLARDVLPPLSLALSTVSLGELVGGWGIGGEILWD